MRFGFVVPWADAGDVGELAVAAEAAGWDGLFVWEPVFGVDAWASLTVAAMRTTTLRLGTMLTPIPRRLPWELAGQVATLDRLSGGRVVLAAGLGAPDAGYHEFGLETDRRVRAALLDEGLDVMTGLWGGQPFRYQGQHYRIEPSEFPAIGHTVQQPRVPIWLVGALGRRPSMERALRWDGLLPTVVGDEPGRQATLDELRAAMAEIRAVTGGRPFDVVIEGSHDEHCPAAWADAGATWWLESMWSAVNEVDAVGAALDVLRDGPPRSG